MNIWHSFGGMLEVVLTSADLEKTFSRINSRKIEISNLVWLDDLTCSFRIHRRAYHELQQLCAASGENLKIRKKIGLYWTGNSVFSRPVFLIGTVWLILLAIWLPTRVLFLRVDGNQSVPEKRILAAAEKHLIVLTGSMAQKKVPVLCLECYLSGEKAQIFRSPTLQS